MTGTALITGRVSGFSCCLAPSTDSPDPHLLRAERGVADFTTYERHAADVRVTFTGRAVDEVFNNANRRQAPPVTQEYQCP